MYKIYTIFLIKMPMKLKKLIIFEFEPKNLTLQNLIK